MPPEFTPAELEFLRGILATWVYEGFTTPPYEPVFYDVFEKLGLDPDGAWDYDVRRPSERS